MSNQFTNMQYVKHEFFNPNAMHTLLNHPGLSCIQKQTLQKYYKKRQNGNCVQTIYNWCKDYAVYNVGRVYVSHSLGLQGFERDIRNALAHGLYWDLDMVNAHPTILLQTCKNKGWSCNLLEHYVNNRQQVLNEIMQHYGCACKDAKNLMIRMLFLGFPEAWVGDTICENSTHPMPFIDDFKQELQIIANNVWMSFTEISDIVKRKKKKTQQQKISSCLSLYLQSEEHRILMAIDEALKMQGRCLDTYIYDGGLVRKLKDENELPSTIINKCEEHVKKLTTYKINLIVKDLETTFIIDDVNENDYYNMKKEFEETHFKVMCPLVYVEHKNDGSFYLRDSKELTGAFRNKYCLVAGEKTRFIDRWLDDPNIRTYDKIDFLPPPLPCPSNTFNMWSGFAIERLDVESSGNIEPFLKHISVLTNHNEHGSKYFTYWIADMFKRPGTLNGIAIAIKSDQGAGKNIFLEGLAKIMGNDLYFETADPQNQLWSRFALGRKNRVLINIDETKGKDTYPMADIIKNMITSKFFNYEDKGKRPITLTNINRIVFTTNNISAIKVEQKDRRYVVFEASNELLGNKTYFDELGKYFDDPSNQKAIFDYLMSLDVSTVDWIGDRPITDLYKDIQSLNVSNDVKYLKYMCENNRDDSVFCFKPSSFFEHYKEVMGKCGYSIDRSNDGNFYIAFKKYVKEGRLDAFADLQCIRKLRGDSGFVYKFIIQDVKNVLVSLGHIKDDGYLIRDDF
jgi:hypothetical protein